MKLDDLIDNIHKSNIPASIRLSKCEYIKDTSIFIEAHTQYLKSQRGTRGYLPYYKRLFKFYMMIKD